MSTVARREEGWIVWDSYFLCRARRSSVAKRTVPESMPLRAPSRHTEWHDCACHWQHISVCITVPCRERALRLTTLGEVAY